MLVYLSPRFFVYPLILVVVFIYYIFSAKIFGSYMPISEKTIGKTGFAVIRFRTQCKI